MLPSAASLDGKAVAHVTFKARPDDTWRDIASAAQFTGRTVVLFSVPGACTPTSVAAYFGSAAA